MAEDKMSASDLLKQINDFEKTIDNLTKNVTVLKQKLKEKQSQFGEDMSKWPEGKK